MTNPKIRLEKLRAALRAENISYGELAELQDLSAYIDAGDTELLEAAGVPEYPEEEIAGDDPNDIGAEYVSGDAVDDGAITGLGA